MNVGKMVESGLIEAQRSESLCALKLIENYADVLDVKRASSREDMYLHFDLVAYLKDGSTRRIDVKGLKSMGHGRKKTGDYHWIELKNVNGAKGWLYGEADIIAFQVSEDDFILVDRLKLVEYVSNLLDTMEDKKVYRTDPLDFAERYAYKRIFTRHNPELPAQMQRYDQTIIVETDKLKELSSKTF